MSFIKYSKDCDFTFENLPYGVFSTESDLSRRIGVAIGDYILDMKKIANSGVLKGRVGDYRTVFCEGELNSFMEMGREFWQETRSQLQDLLRESNPMLQGRHEQEYFFVEQKDATMRFPVIIGEFTDFYSSIHHAINVGKLFRSVENPLLPNWRHIPIAYHGRASTVAVSNTPIFRPYGVICPKQGEPPVFEPSRAMDYELEVAFFLGGTPNKMGAPIKMEEAADRIFGFVLMNDWSARDIQKFEYQPLGPFVAKNVGTTISPWIVTLEALMPFRTDNFVQDPKPLPHLRHDDPFNFDINLSVQIKTATAITQVGTTNFKELYWTPKQQLVHHASSGCVMNSGDLIGSGTISGPDQVGSLLELTLNGTHPIHLLDGTARSFLKDNDEIVIKGYAQKGSVRVGFGACTSKLLPALELK